MTKWKWMLAARIPAKVFVINENGDYFWLDRKHLGAIRQFVLFRSGSGRAPGRCAPLARLFSFPFTLLYLLLYATVVHAAGLFGTGASRSRQSADVHRGGR